MVSAIKKTDKTETAKGSNKRKGRINPFAKYCLLLAALPVLGYGTYALLEFSGYGDVGRLKSKPVQMSVTRKSEKKKVKKKAENKCFANRAPVSCSLKKPLAKGVITATRPLRIGNLLLRLEEVMSGDESGDKAELTVLDSCSKVLDNSKYSIISPKAVKVNGAEYLIHVTRVHIPDENGTKWAEVTVWLSCPHSGCEKISQILDTMENSHVVLQSGNVAVSFKGVNYDGKTMKAVLLIENSGRKSTVEVPEGESVAVAKNHYVKVPAMGYDCDTGNSWAKVELYDSLLP